MVSFKGAHYPKDIILHAIFSMSGIPLLIATLKKFWGKGEALLICKIKRRHLLFKCLWSSNTQERTSVFKI